MTCGNASGTHTLRLLKSKNPRFFKNVRNLPEIYNHQHNAWRDSRVFSEWISDVFMPEVKKVDVNDLMCCF